MTTNSISGEQDTDQDQIPRWREGTNPYTNLWLWPLAAVVLALQAADLLLAVGLPLIRDRI